MKKIILIVLFFIGSLSVKAEENVFWSDEVLDDSSLELLYEEIRYKWYWEGSIYTNDYFIEGNNPTDFPFKLDEDYIITPFSEWDHDPIDLDVNNRIIEERVVNKYRVLRPIRYIFFEEMIGGFTTFRISELKVLIDGISINYDIECNNCSTDFDVFINNGVINEDKAYVTNGGGFRIDLGDYYTIDQVRIELYMRDSVPNTKRCKIYMNENNTIDDRNYAYKYFETYVVSSSGIKPDKYLIIPNETWIVNPVYQDWVYIDGFLNSTYYRQMISAVERRYRDIKYRYYKIERNYLEGYHNSVEGNYMKDEEQTATYYQYRILNNSEFEEDNSAVDDNNQMGEVSNETIYEQTDNPDEENGQSEQEVINPIDNSNETDTITDQIDNIKDEMVSVEEEASIEKDDEPPTAVPNEKGNEPFYDERIDDDLSTNYDETFNEESQTIITFNTFDSSEVSNTQLDDGSLPVGKNIIPSIKPATSDNYPSSPENNPIKKETIGIKYISYKYWPLIIVFLLASLLLILLVIRKRRKYVG